MVKNKPSQHELEVITAWEHRNRMKEVERQEANERERRLYGAPRPDLLGCLGLVAAGTLIYGLISYLMSK